MSEVVEGRPPKAEESQLAALFSGLEKGQLDHIDAAAKRVIELDTGLLGVLFAITAFGEKFPPPYLAGNTLAKVCVVLTMASLLGATFCAMLVLQPRDYTYNRYRTDEMRETLEKIIRDKSVYLRFSGLLFFLGSAALGLLITSLILNA